MNRERVNKVVNDVEEAVVSVREAEESWRGEMREIRGEVESVRELVPRVSRCSFMIYMINTSHPLCPSPYSPLSYKRRTAVQDPAYE